jgi:hypothetical protein
MCNLKVGPTIGIMHYTQPREGDLKGHKNINLLEINLARSGFRSSHRSLNLV